MFATKSKNIMPSDLDQAFEQAREQDLKAVAAIHRQIFSTTLSGQLGERFLEEYYRKIKISPGGIVIVCENKGQVIGFISGLSSKDNFLFPLLIKNVWSILKELAVHPTIFKNIFRFIKRSLVLKEGKFNAELMALAVLEEYRGKGLASGLVARMEEFFVSKNVKEYKVFTDLKSSTGYGFYEKSGFRLFQEVDLLGVQARLYFKTITF